MALNNTAAAEGAARSKEIDILKPPDVSTYVFEMSNEVVSSDVFREQKLGSGQVWGLLFGFRSGSGINISGTSASGFLGFGGF